jgi:hypothetical protein
LDDEPLSNYGRSTQFPQANPVIEQKLSLLGREFIERSSSVSEERKHLFDKTISKQMIDVAFSGSHGAFEDHLGAGGLYYALATMLRSQVSVCIGSGGGFVPRLLRRAQEDLGLTNAHTYLVDANLPDLGFGHPMQPGGWLTEGNDLQTLTPSLTVLRMLSEDAAQLFASAGVQIDYLHIDGDHSTRGVIADVSSYLPLLSSKAIVSLHDLRMKSVREAMLEVERRYPALEWVTFAEVGNGTAVLRRRSAALPRQLPPSISVTDDLGRATHISEEIALRETEQSQTKARYERWHYLTSPSYRSRYDLVARSIDLAGCTVVEIGGFPNSVIRHLHHAKRVIAVEPYAPPQYLAEIQGLAAERGIDLLVLRGRLGATELTAELLGDYTLVALGLDVSGGCDTAEEFHAALRALLDLAVRAEISAIECPGYPPSQVALQCILACIEPKIIQDITLDLSQDPAADEYYVKDARAKRRILILKPGPAPPPSHWEPILSRCAALFPDLIKGLPVQAEAVALGLPQKSNSYELGETIHFKHGLDTRGVLVSGWSGLGPSSVWGIERASKLQLDVTRLAEQAGPVALRLDLIPFVVGRKVPLQRLAILVNGARVFKGAIQSRGFLDVPVPLDVLCRKTPIQIVLIHPDGAKPGEVIKTSQDFRVLSIALRSIAFVDVAGIA